VSPDGRNVYIAGVGVVSFARDRHTGALRPLAGGRSAYGLSGAFQQVVASGDGHTLYAAGGGTLVVLERSARTGALRQLECFNSTGTNGCTAARGLLTGCCGLALGENPANLYASSTAGGRDTAKFALATFSRSSATGALTQSGCASKDGADGCAVTAFSTPEPINWAGDLAVSPDGGSVYLVHESLFPAAEAGCPDSFVSALRRDSGSGALGAPAGEAESCGLAMTMSPDGRTIYTVSDFSDIVTVFRRNPQSGALTRTSCVADSFRGCSKARNFDSPASLAVSPDGRYAYVATANSIDVFSRQR
jgi:DNA-binding beta-propeller fold protein YncE